MALFLWPTTPRPSGGTARKQGVGPERAGGGELRSTVGKETKGMP